MKRRVRFVLLGGGLGLLLLAAAACADVKPVQDKIAAVEQKVAGVESKIAGMEAKIGKIVAPTREVEFAVTGVELKGSTSVDSLAVPPKDPKTLSDGYRYKGPGDADKSDPKKWEVSTYVWEPGAMTVLQGDQVKLKIFIVNGDKHTTWLEGPDGKEVVKEEVQNRGREYHVHFTASQVGTYKLICNEHDPTMKAVISVLPRT